MVWTTILAEHRRSAFVCLLTLCIVSVISVEIKQPVPLAFYAETVRVCTNDTSTILAGNYNTTLGFGPNKLNPSQGSWTTFLATYESDGTSTATSDEYPFKLGDLFCNSDSVYTSGVSDKQVTLSKDGDLVCQSDFTQDVEVVGIALNGSSIITLARSKSTSYILQKSETGPNCKREEKEGNIVLVAESYAAYQMDAGKFEIRDTRSDTVLVTLEGATSVTSLIYNPDETDNGCLYVTGGFVSNIDATYDGTGSSQIQGSDSAQWYSLLYRMTAKTVILKSGGGSSDSISTFVTSQILSQDSDELYTLGYFGKNSATSNPPYSMFYTDRCCVPLAAQFTTFVVTIDAHTLECKGIYSFGVNDQIHESARGVSLAQFNSSALSIAITDPISFYHTGLIALPVAYIPIPDTPICALVSPTGTTTPSMVPISSTSTPSVTSSAPRSSTLEATTEASFGSSSYSQGFNWMLLVVIVVGVIIVLAVGAVYFLYKKKAVILPIVTNEPKDVPLHRFSKLENEFTS